MIAGIIQARLGSTRFSQKVLKELPEGGGVPMLARVIRRVKKTKKLDEIMVATCDRECADIARAEDVSWCIGDEDDVLGRFYHAAKGCGADIIIRITADCPCIDPATIDGIVGEHIQTGWDLTYNRNDNLAYCNEIDGLDVEVFSFDALKKAHENATVPEDREHVTRWMYDNLKSVARESGWHIENAEDIKLSVDTEEDYERICKIYKALGPDFDTKDLVKYLEKEKK